MRTNSTQRSPHLYRHRPARFFLGIVFENWLSDLVITSFGIGIDRDIDELEKVLDIVGVGTEIVIQNVSIAVLGSVRRSILLSMPLLMLMLLIIPEHAITIHSNFHPDILHAPHTHPYPISTPQINNPQLKKASWIPMTNKNTFLARTTAKHRAILGRTRNNTRNEPRMSFAQVVFGDDRNITPTLSVGVILDTDKIIIYSVKVCRYEC